MMQKKFNFFLLQESGAFGNNVKKEPQKSRPKLKRHLYFIFTDNICSGCNSMQVIVFCKLMKIVKCINFVKRLKFPHFKGSIIP